MADLLLREGRWVVEVHLEGEPGRSACTGDTLVPLDGRYDALPRSVCADCAAARR